MSMLEVFEFEALQHPFNEHFIFENLNSQLLKMSQELRLRKNHNRKQSIK